MWQLFEYVAYVFAPKKLRLTTIESHLSAVKCFHRISCGFELDITHLVLTSAFKGAACSHADVGSQPAVRRPVSWAMSFAGETLIPAWRNRGCVIVARSVFVVLFLDPCVRNVCGDPSAVSQDVLFMSGRCDLFRGQSQITTVGSKLIEHTITDNSMICAVSTIHRLLRNVHRKVQCQQAAIHMYSLGVPGLLVAASISHNT